MTILDESKDGNKYNHLTYAEFQEMLCRVALNHISIEQHLRANSEPPIERLVYTLVE